MLGAAERLAVLAAMLHTGMPIKCVSLNAVSSYDTARAAWRSWFGTRAAGKVRRYTATRGLTLRNIAGRA
jgi:hypothetical protein